jgi:formate dehydrogenase beta subunit
MDRRSAIKLMVSVAAGAAGAALGTDRATASSQVSAPPEAVGMLYDTTLCIGCKTCVVACAEANKLEPDRGLSNGLYQAPISLNAKTKSIIKLFKEGSESSFVKSQCMHCLDPACISACMLGALKKDEKGIVFWEGSRCVGCRYCQVACPYNVPKFEWASNNPRIVKCELCRDRLAEGLLPACVEVCPRKAVIYGKRDELLEEARRRLKEHPGLYIPKIYGEHDAGGTQILYLSHVFFEKIGLPELGDRPVPETVRKVQGSIYYGFVAPVALYGLLATIVRRNQRQEAAKEKAGSETVKEEQL